MMLDNLSFLEPRSPMLHNTETENEEPDSKRKKPSIYDETYLWHLRLGYINLNIVQPLAVNESYLKGKMTKRRFTGKGQRAQECLQLM